MKNATYKDIFSRLNHISILHRINIIKKSSALGVHFGQFPILEYIKKHNNCTQKEIAKQLFVSPPSVAVSIKRMEKSGLVKKSIDEKDTRYNRLTLTPKGEEVVAKSGEIFDEYDKSIFKNFSQQECNEFLSYLDRLIQNMTGENFDMQNMFSLIAQEKELIVQEKKEDIK